MLHICCIRAGTAFAPAYVDIIFDSVRRNLADGFEGEFVCFTDQTDELAPGIVVRPLPADLPKWWSKLALFRADLFPEGDRVLFLDLDTVITGRLDEIAAYDGPFAILRDFYVPEGLQSSVMAWRAGECSAIWEGYQRAGCPTSDPHGDQAWIERSMLHSAVRLQDVFPGLFCSFKLIKGPPSTASVVVFHGEPRPHEVRTGWVPEVWKVGGMSRADLDTVCNTAKERLLSNVRANIALDLPWLDKVPPHDRHVVIVGGGPSLADTLEEVRWRKSIGQEIWALNGTARYLAVRGIQPDLCVLADARPKNWHFLGGFHGSVLAASQCDPSVFRFASVNNFEWLTNRPKVEMWHVHSDGIAEVLEQDRTSRPIHLIGGGSTVGLNAMILAFVKGFRTIHLYGFDSSFRDGAHHAYAQPQNNDDRVIDALYGDRHFKTTAWMAQQVNEFQETAAGLLNDGCTLTIAGDGLLQTVARDMAALAA